MSLMYAVALAALTMLLAELAPAAPAAGVATPGPAATVPVPAPTRDPLVYDDPGVHFRAPDGWTRVDLGALASDAGGKAPPAALYVFHRGKSDERSILIDIQPFEGTLDGLESSKETELRNAAEGTFVDRKVRTTLSNGMPAYFIKVSQPGGPVGHQLRRYDYVIYDLTRSIDVAYVGRYGDFDESDVQKALASLSVVVYPRNRR